MTPNIKTVLEALCPAIAEVDGGCDTCASTLVARANDALAAIEVPLRFVMPDDWYDQETFPPKITVEGAPDAA